MTLIRAAVAASVARDTIYAGPLTFVTPDFLRQCRRPLRSKTSFLILRDAINGTTFFQRHKETI